MTSPSDRFRENLRAASKIKLEPEIWFSHELASYARHLARYEQLHADAMAICLLNIIAIASRNSFIRRRGNAYVPLNLYNFIIARSGFSHLECSFGKYLFILIGYGKSDILSRVERSIKQSARYHAEKFATMSNKRENMQMEEEIIKKKKNAGEQCTATSDKPTKLVLPVPRVIFNDGTGAGILNQLDSCTRALLLHEADTTIGSWNVIQSGPLDRTSTRIDPFRSTLMTLYEDPGNFTRMLKNEQINTKDSKLILLGASTGELIVSQLGRIAGRQMADAFFERITLFPLEGDPIANEDCLSEIDTSRFPSLEQFGVICGFLGDVKLQLDEEGGTDLARLSLEMKQSSNDEDENDHLSSRLAKTSQLIYRLTGFLCLLENAVKIADMYLADFGSFGDGQPSPILFDGIQSIVEKKYGSVLGIGTNQHLLVENSVANRAKDIALGNFEQYKLLLFVERDDGRNWNILSAGQLKFVSSGTSNNPRSSYSDERACQVTSEKRIRRVQNLLSKSNSLKVDVLLHDSIIFTSSGLQVDWKLKEASLVLTKSILPELVSERLLLSIKPGIIDKWNKPTVYIKTVPGGKVSREDLDRMLASYGDKRLTMDIYLDKCKTIKMEGSGKVSEVVFEVFDRPEYEAMKLDLTVLRNLKPSQKTLLKRLRRSHENSSTIGNEFREERFIDDDTNDSLISTLVNTNIDKGESPTISIDEIRSGQMNTLAMTTMSTNTDVDITRSSKQKRKKSNDTFDDAMCVHDRQVKHPDPISARLRPRKASRKNS